MALVFDGLLSHIDETAIWAWMDEQERSEVVEIINDFSNDMDYAIQNMTKKVAQSCNPVLILDIVLDHLKWTGFYDDEDIGGDSLDIPDE